MENTVVETQPVKVEEIKKIGFAIYSVTRNEDWREIYLAGTIKEADISAFEEIKVFEHSLWQGENKYTVGKMIDFGNRSLLPIIREVTVTLEDYSNLTQAFYKATGVQLDARYV